jgi:hypothetical protein
VTDLERFFRQIVRNLAAADPARLHRPLPLGDIRGTIVPYRSNRRALQLETSEDYELVLMRLCAGEGGFARTEPEEVRAKFVAEIRSPNPDLTIVERHENAVVSLEATPLAQALDPAPELAFAPPDLRFQNREAEEEATPLLDLPPLESFETVPEVGPTGERCAHCGDVLPSGRAVNFCPHCGQPQSLTHCPECGTEVEPGWRHCVNCGATVGS